MKRVILIVMDSLGVGAMPDAEQYKDEGSHTLGHIMHAYPELYVPNLAGMGIFKIDGMENYSEHLKNRDKHLKQNIIGSYGRLKEKSKGKDTITGHWEIAGIITDNPFNTFERFPDKFIDEFEKRTGRKTIGNYPASGTEIIDKLGEEHERTGAVIVYTSADSVFQIAANTAVVPLKELYNICEVARELLIGDLQVGRVIARPYIKDEYGKRKRTADRKDYAISPPGDTMLSNIKKSGQRVVAVGKIGDIYNGKGVSDSYHTDDNTAGVDKTVEMMKLDFSGLIFTNLVDFDSKFGHRRDACGYGKALEEFDERLSGITGAMREDDILILCADHGNDPLAEGWDHTRETVPVLVSGKCVKTDINLGTRESFADIGATVCEYLGVENSLAGESFLHKIIIEEEK